MENRVNVKSTVDAYVSITDPQTRINRVWERKGVVRQFTIDELRELSYDNGIWNMLQDGTLYIEDMEAKIELGLESPDATEPQNVIVLTDQQKKRYLTVAPIQDLKDICSKLTTVEIDNLIDYAIENQIVNYDKCEYLKKLTGRDIVKSIELIRADNND